jgi:outer membrane usher protein
MTRRGHRICLWFGASLLALTAPSIAWAESGQEATSAPPARAERLNPTGRNIVLTVPAKDGATYLGDMPLTIGADDSLSFPAERALQVLSEVLAPDVIETLRTRFAGRPTVGPQDFATSGIQVSYNPRTLELSFTIPVERRASRRISVTALDRARIGEVIRPANFSAYLNVRGSVDLVEQGFDTGFQEPVFLLDGAARLGQFVLESDAIWNPGGIGRDFQRLGTRVVLDDLDNVVRWTFGDLETQSRGFQSVPDIAGFGVNRSYSILNPQQIVRPRGDQTFQLERPATVEVLVNGQLVRRLQLAPGQYNMRDFPFAQGANDIRVNILDDAGRTETLRFNFFMDQTQLATGLTEFGAYFGVQAPLGVNGPDYSDDVVLSGFIRHGLSDRVTVGANFQGDARTKIGGLEAVFATAIGSFGLQGALSDVKGVGGGGAFQATFQRLFQRRNGQADTFNLFFEHRSRNFAPVAFFLPVNPFKYEVGGGYTHAFNQYVYAGFDARFSKGRGTVSDVHNYRLTSGWRISPRTTLTAEGRYERDSRGKLFSGFLSLTHRFGRNSSIRTEYDSRDNRMRASYQTLSGSGVGSYNVTADVERSDLGAGVNVNANYFTNRAELGFSHFGNFTRGFGSSLNQRSTFRMGTSIAFADGTASVGRPIYDSFAIVKPHKSLKKADVLVEPTPFGLAANTGTLGAATMPSLSSYSERTVPVDVANAPAGTDIGQGSFKLFPTYRSGYVLEVGSDYNVTALGTMLDIDGQPVSLVSGTAKQIGKADGPTLTMFTNRDGRFGATGLAPGKWRVEMLDAKKSVFIITIPEDSQGIVRLGEIAAEKDR